MKHFFTLLFASCFLFPLAIIAQSNNTNSTNALVKAYKGNKALLTNAYANNSVQLQVSIDSLNNKTPDSIVAIATGYKWYRADMHYWIWKVKTHSDTLGITPSQQAALIVAARKVWYCKNEPDSTPYFDVLSFEIATIKAKLTKKQITLFLQLVNMPTANLLAKQVWQKATIAGATGKANVE